MQAGAELRVVADAVGDRRQPATIVHALRGLGFDAVAAAAAFAPRRERRNMGLQVGHGRRHLPPPATSASFPRSGKLGLLASCAISRSPSSITPSWSDTR